MTLARQLPASAPAAGVRCLRLKSDGKSLLSAGADGHIIEWDVSSGDLLVRISAHACPPARLPALPSCTPAPAKPRAPPEPPPQDGAVVSTVPVRSAYESTTPPIFYGLDCYPGSNVFIAGTHRCASSGSSSSCARACARLRPLAPPARGPSARKRPRVPRCSLTLFFPGSAPHCRCDIWEVDESPDVLIYGHSGDAMAVSWNPANPAVFATVADSARRHPPAPLRPC